MSDVSTEFMKMTVKNKLATRARAVESTSRSESVESTGERTLGQQRERRLPPKPSWYGSRDQATLSSLAAKNTLTSRNGVKRR
jgi:hypothetical protein